MRHCADARNVWNFALEQTNFYRLGMDSSPSYNEQAAQLAEARKGTWLGEGSSSVQQAALKDFHQGMRSWWGGSHRPPTWRRRFCSRVLLYPRRGRSQAVPEMGDGAGSEVWTGPVSVVAPDAGQPWHGPGDAGPVGPVARFLLRPQAPVERTATGAVVGIDRGVANTLTTSDGEHLRIPTPTVSARARWERRPA